MKIGNFLKDNDPRMGYRSALKIIEIYTDYVKALDVKSGRIFKYKLSRIHTDGKPRKSGLSLFERIYPSNEFGYRPDNLYLSGRP
jgi:hypothetical protein